MVSTCPPKAAPAQYIAELARAAQQKQDGMQASSSAAAEPSPGDSASSADATPSAAAAGIAASSGYTTTKDAVKSSMQRGRIAIRAHQREGMVSDFGAPHNKELVSAAGSGSGSHNKGLKVSGSRGSQHNKELVSDIGSGGSQHNKEMEAYGSGSGSGSQHKEELVSGSGSQHNNEDSTEEIEWTVVQSDQ